MMKTQIEKIQIAISKLNFPENQDLLKEFLEQKYKQELIKVFQNEWIDINLLRNNSIKKIIFSILWWYIAKNIILKEIDKEELIEKFFYNEFLKNIKIWNTIWTISYWQNLVINYKNYIKKEITNLLSKNDIKIVNPLVEGISIFFVKKEQINELYTKITDLIVNELWTRWKHYQKLIFFLSSYFSGSRIYMWYKKYVLPTINLFPKKWGIQLQVTELSNIKKEINSKEKEINYLIWLKQDLIKEKNKLINKLNEKKSYLSLLSKKINDLSEKTKIINLKIKENNQIIQKENMLFWYIKNIQIKKENNILKEKRHNILMNIGSYKEKIKELKHSIFLIESNIDSIKKT